MVEAIGVEDAEREILAKLGEPKLEDVDLPSARGRVLGADIFADRAMPPYSRIMMDGLVMHWSDWQAGRREYHVIGDVLSGGAAEPDLAEGEALRVATGAMVPSNGDLVVPREECKWEGGVDFSNAVGQSVKIVEKKRHEGEHIHRKASDAAAGWCGANIGTAVGAAEIALLASWGYREVEVMKKPRVIVFGSGDELVGVEEIPRQNQIRQSNASAIAATLAASRLAEVASSHLIDDFATAERAIDDTLHKYDWVVICGGISQGEHDVVKKVLGARCEKVFQGVLQKPGRPMGFWIWGEKLIFGLPGNPLSALACTARYILPALRHFLKVQWVPTLLNSPQKIPRDKKYALNYFATPDLAKNNRVARVNFCANSGDLTALRGATGIIQTPPDEGLTSEQDFVPFYPFY